MTDWTLVGGPCRSHIRRERWNASHVILGPDNQRILTPLKPTRPLSQSQVLFSFRIGASDVFERPSRQKTWENPVQACLKRILLGLLTSSNLPLSLRCEGLLDGIYESLGALTFFQIQNTVFDFLGQRS